MQTDSDFVVCVAKVFSVEKHPGADRLDVVTVGTNTPFPGISVICSRGDYKTGDEVVYVSPGSIVNLEDPRWHFLRSRAGWKFDEKGNCLLVGKPTYRIKPMTLRGVKSWGITTPLPEALTSWDIGEDMSVVLGITKYVDSVAEEKRHNIQKNTPPRKGLFARIINRLFSGETRHMSAPEYGVTNLRYGSPFLPDENVLVTEKVHGTNVRFVRFGNKLYVGSHRTWKTDNRSRVQKFFRTKGEYNASSWYGSDIYTTAVSALRGVMTIDEGVVFYGEIVGKTPGGKDIQPGFNYGFTGPEVLLFCSAWDTKKGRWVVAGLCLNECVVDGVPMLYADTPYNSAFDDYKEYAELDSVFGGVREGVVLHSMDRPGVAGKYVSERYKSL